MLPRLPRRLRFLCCWGGDTAVTPLLGSTFLEDLLPPPELPPLPEESRVSWSVEEEDVLSCTLSFLRRLMFRGQSVSSARFKLAVGPRLRLSKSCGQREGAPQIITGFPGMPGANPGDTLGWPPSMFCAVNPTNEEAEGGAVYSSQREGTRQGQCSHQLGLELGRQGIGWIVDSRVWKGEVLLRRTPQQGSFGLRVSPVKGESRRSHGGHGAALHDSLQQRPRAVRATGAQQEVAL